METKTITYTIYNFDELSDTAKEKALNWAREIAAECSGDDFDGYLHDEFKEDLATKGFLNAKVSYSGFWSQGDGASFSCDVDVLKFMRFYKLCGAYRALYNALKTEKVEITLNISNNGHYCHEYTMQLDNLYFNNYDYDEGNKEDWKKFVNLENTYYQHIHSLILQYARKEAKAIYRKLEQNYYDSVSDESVKDLIECNEWTFDENGKRKD